MILKLNRAGSQCPPTETALPRSSLAGSHSWQSSHCSWTEHSATPTGYTPATSGLACFLGTKWAGELQVVKKPWDLERTTGMV